MCLSTDISDVKHLLERDECNNQTAYRDGMTLGYAVMSSLRHFSRLPCTYNYVRTYTIHFVVSYVSCILLIFHSIFSLLFIDVIEILN